MLLCGLLACLTARPAAADAPTIAYDRFELTNGLRVYVVVAAAAKGLMSSGSMAIAIVGDVAKIRGELDKLGLGAPAMYDLDAAPLPAK
jgi:hypothetical protein